MSTESFLSNKGPENEEISQEAYCMSDAEKKEEEHKEEIDFSHSETDLCNSWRFVSWFLATGHNHFPHSQ